MLSKYDFGTNKHISFVGRSSIFEVLALCDVFQARDIPNLFHRSHAVLKLKHTKLPRSNLGMERLREQLINNDPFPFGGRVVGVKRGPTYLTLTLLFADYVGNLHAGSPFST